MGPTALLAAATWNDGSASALARRQPARQPQRHRAASPANRICFSQGSGRAFYRAVHLGVAEYFARTGKSPFADATIWLKSACYLAMALAAYALILFGGFGAWMMLAFANVYGIAGLLLSINLGHDGAHGALSRRRWVNQVALYGSFILVGADPYLWQLRHTRSHHVFPNVNGSDIDIDNNLFLCLSPNHQKRWYMRYQHIYAPFIFWLVDIHTVFIQDVHYLLKRRLANMTDIRHPPSAYVGFVACKAAFVALAFGIPAMMLPLAWWQVLLGGLTVSFISSCLFVYLLIGTHFAEETAFPETDASGRLAHDWPTHAMLTSLDWNPYSRLAHAIAGGSNAHAAHHLFPNVSHAHYRVITRIIAERAAEFGVPHHVTTLPRMVRSHFRFLKAMSVA
jgi:linoleoyl-CoA desaturase